jgi:hypothetical protein
MDVEEARREVEESKRKLASLAPEANRRNAALLREVMSKLATARQRELAEEMAGEFEQRALVQSRSE